MRRYFKYTILGAWCVGAMLGGLPLSAAAEPEREYNIQPQDLGSALRVFAKQSDHEILFSSDLTAGKHTAGLHGRYDVDAALETLLAGTGLRYRVAERGALLIEPQASRGVPAPRAIRTAAVEQRSPAASRSEGPASSVEEVIVTAQRRAERIEDVPMAIAVVTGDDISKSGVVGMQDLGRIASGVQINSSAFTAPAIRGVTTLTVGPGIENNVAIYLDGFYEPNTNAINFDLVNISSIEVLKGPQGTLYGRNATGGAILINTLAPTATLTGKLEVGYGRFNDRTFTGYISGPASKNIRYSLAGYYRKSDGYIKLISPTTIGATIGDASPMEQRSIRTKLEFDVSDNFKAVVSYNYGYVNDNRGQLFSGLQHVPATLPPPPGRVTSIGQLASNVTNIEPITTHEGTLTLSYDSSVASVTSHTGYLYHDFQERFDLDGTYANVLSFATRTQQDTFQQAVDVTVKAIKNLDLLVGALYFHDFSRQAPPLFSTTYGVNGAVISNNQ